MTEIRHRDDVQCGHQGLACPADHWTETYNGWTNRETWAVALHVNNDQGWQETVHIAIRNRLDYEGDSYEFGDVTDDDRARWAGEAIREEVEGMFSLMREGDSMDLFDIREDIGSLWRVDWTELGRSFLADIEGES